MNSFAGVFKPQLSLTTLLLFSKKPFLVALSMATCLYRKLINAFMGKKKLFKDKNYIGLWLSRSNEIKNSKMSFTSFILVSLRNLSVSEYHITYKWLKAKSYSKNFIETNERKYKLVVWKGSTCLQNVHVG